MTINEYQQLAMTTLNPELSEKDVLINGVMGLCGESGEAIDLVKKWLAQGHELDREKLAKELGDICWYLAETATAIGYDLEDIMAANIEKLKSATPRALKPNGLSTARNDLSNLSLSLRWSDGILWMPGDADCHTSLRAGSQ